MINVWESVCLRDLSMPLAVIEATEGEVGSMSLEFDVELEGMFGEDDLDEMVSFEELRLAVNQFPRRRRIGGPEYCDERR